MTKQSASALKQSMLYGASIALMKGVSLLVLPVTTHQLSTAQFGQLEIISTVGIIGGILVGMGLEDTLFRFAGTAHSQHQRRKVAADIFSLTLIVTTIALITGWQLAADIARVIPGQPTLYQTHLMLGLLALEGCIAIPLGWLRMNNHIMSFFWLTCGRAILQAMLVVLFLYLGRGVAGVLEAGLIAAVLQALILAYLHIFHTGLSFSMVTTKKALLYSIPIVASGLVSFSLNGFDRWVLAEYHSLADVAEFAVASKFALAAALLLQPFSMWWTPRRFTVLQATDGKQNVGKFIAMGASLAILCCVLVGLATPVLLTWLLPASYTSTGQYSVALVLVTLLKELTQLFSIGCFTGKTTTTQLCINIITAIFGIGCMFWLTPYFQVWGVISALLLAQALRLLLFYHASQHFLPLQLPLPALLTLASLGSFWLWLGIQMPGPSQLLAILLLAAASMLLTCHLLKLIPLSTKDSSKAVE